jgi:hypothetical protein
MKYFNIVTSLGSPRVISDHVDMWHGRKKNLRSTWEIVIINLIFLSYLFRTAIPFLKYPFLILFTGLIIYTLFKFSNLFGPSLREFFRTYSIIIFLVIFLILAFLLSNKLYLIIFKDVVNSIILIIVFFISSIYVKTKKTIEYFIHYFNFLVIFFALIISLNSLLNLFNISSGSDNLLFSGVGSDSDIVYPAIDNNFGTLPVIFGMIACFYFILRRNNSSQIVLLNLALIPFTFSIVFSGSKRGLLVLLIVLTSIIVLQMLRLVSRNQMIIKICSRTRYYLMSVFLISLFSFLFVFYTTNNFKNRTLELIGSKNLLHTKQKIAGTMVRYTSVVFRKLSFVDIYNIIWTPVFNPYDPESAWGTRSHKTIFKLTGPNVDIVPIGAKGYLLDRTSNSSYYPESNTCEAYSLIASLNANAGDHYQASVYCFVSEDFNGSQVSIGNTIENIEKKRVTGKTVDYYNLSSKGVWQKLEIEFYCKRGDFPIFLSLTDKGVKNFSTLKGYVIFAYPDFQIIGKSDSILSSFNHEKQKLIKLNESCITEQQKNKFYKLNLRSSFSLEIADFINCSYLIKDPFDITIKKNVVLSSIQGPFYINSQLINYSQDPIRKLASKFIAEDSTYYGLNHSFIVDTTLRYSGDERLIRWKFAMQIFAKEYNLSQKLFGYGFRFLNWYGYYFLKDKTKSDWPHNPFLSILLYSGIFGLLIFCFFIYKVLYLYLKYRKEYPLLFIFFLITFFFSFFSGGSPFDPPIMGFFVILPFFIHSVHKRLNIKEIDNSPGSNGDIESKN